MEKIKGMTLWDWYAAHCPEAYLERKKEMGVVAASAQYANEMLAERRKRESEL